MSGKGANTKLLRGTYCWCASCRQRIKSSDGGYVVLPGGLRQQWICKECYGRKMKTK